MTRVVLALLRALNLAPNPAGASLAGSKVTGR